MNNHSARVALVTALVAGAAFMALPAKATTINWTFSAVTFNDGGTASGTFSTDSVSGFLLAYDIVTTSGSALGGFEYTNINSSVVPNLGGSNNSFELFFNFTRYFELQFVSPLTSPGIIALVPGPQGGTTGWDGSWECMECDPFRNVISGEAVATPLPAALPLFASGLGALGLFGWRRKRKNAAVA